jgi:acetylornithine deacetylase
MTLPELVAALVAIDSVNPTLVPGAAGERAITGFVADWLRQRGVAVTEIPSGPLGLDRPSLLGHVPGSRRGRGLMLYGHTDTVGVAGMAAPFTPTRRAAELHGRGAYDMKGSLAAIMRVAAALATEPADGDLWLMIVADEESDSHGAAAILDELARRSVVPGACIVTEPSDLRVMLGHRGFATGTIATHGRAAHTARRDEGVDAIAMMARVIVSLDELDTRLHAGPAHPLLGHSAIVASMVRGGTELFTYPAHCEAEFVWRTVPGQTPAMLTAEIERIFAELHARDPRFTAKLTWRLWRDPMTIGVDAPIAQAIAEAAREVAGRTAATCAAPWWTDAALVQGAGIPVAIYGPAGGGIHAVDEWVDLDSLAQLEQILLRVARRVSPHG